MAKLIRVGNDFVNLDRVTRIRWLPGNSSTAVPTLNFYSGVGDLSVTVHNELAIEAKRFLDSLCESKWEEI
jgi:hypothetical protein